MVSTVSRCITSGGNAFRFAWQRPLLLNCYILSVNLYFLDCTVRTIRDSVFFLNIYIMASAYVGQFNNVKWNGHFKHKQWTRSNDRTKTIISGSHHFPCGIRTHNHFGAQLYATIKKIDCKAVIKESFKCIETLTWNIKLLEICYTKISL